MDKWPAVVETGTEGMDEDLRRGEVVSLEDGTDEVEAEGIGAFGASKITSISATFFRDSSMLFFESSRWIMD